MNKTTQMLFDEHSHIVNAIDSVKQLRTLLSSDADSYRELTTELVNYFRKYADGYHHQKEESILFPLMSKKNELLGNGVIEEMFNQHEDFRGMLDAIEAAVRKGDNDEAQEQLEEYAENMLDHIAVENDELFITAESLLSDDELEKMYFDFQDSDRNLGSSAKTDLENWAGALRSRLMMA